MVDAELYLLLFVCSNSMYTQFKPMRFIDSNTIFWLQHFIRTEQCFRWYMRYSNLDSAAIHRIEGKRFPSLRGWKQSETRVFSANRQLLIYGNNLLVFFAVQFENRFQFCTNKKWNEKKNWCIASCNQWTNYFWCTK